MKVWILAGGRLVATPELMRLRAVPPALVVAADGGIEHAQMLQVTPHLWVGDFDSSLPTDPRFTHIPRQPVARDKDFTDTELALHVARERGASEVTVWGAFGGRFDHTLALALLSVRTSQAGLAVRLHSGDESARPLLPGPPCTLATYPGQLLSVLALDDLRGLRIQGVRWPLAGVDVPAGSGWTVSNEAAGNTALLSVGVGRALIVQRWPHA
ncbi:thiamine diphosphokinase [Deinococcus peraridilitoris]|uniref:Thiamine diphosphokinase n=1 Tax=Deinococcus peraridilitoris (strain DSM 19664 / LMG 22246 / CIP 109416 / KR-200) TaxID=937777 RepID=L0A4G8_DEIPD|nr:thiamine diphosphokinase [Deinococcus peraridilitoris]AFZ68324.1 thiamine pyrophosphokinase [Deinococcus peraridilitoris DSM 19664]